MNYILKISVFIIITFKCTVIILTSEAALMLKFPSLISTSSSFTSLPSSLSSSSSSTLLTLPSLLQSSLPLTFSTILPFFNNLKFSTNYNDITKIGVISIRNNSNYSQFKFNTLKYYNKYFSKTTTPTYHLLYYFVEKTLEIFKLLTTNNSKFNRINKEHHHQQKNKYNATNQYNNSNNNNNNKEKLQQKQKRKKRFLIFNNSGIIKLVIGFSQPIDFGIKNSYQQLNQFWNAQFQYKVPTQPVDILKFYMATFWQTNNNNKNKRSLTYDPSRKYIYKVIELILTQMGFDGENCLLKMICNIAKEPIYGDDSIFHKVLNAILRPPEGSIDDNYLEAKKAGQQWADCSSCYDKCIGFDILEKFSIYL